MALMKRISTVSELPRTFSVITEKVDNKTIYRVDGWLQLANESGVPISEIHGEDAFDLQNKTGLRIGGNNTDNSDQTNNKAIFISTSYLAYDPTILYEFKLRFSNMSVSSTVECGFIGLTSRPTTFSVHSLNEYMADSYNVLFTMIANDKTNIQYTNVATKTHFKAMKIVEEPANPVNTIQENKYGFVTRTGFINSTTVTSNVYPTDTSWTATPQTATKMLAEVVYVVPYFAVNLNSTSKTDGMETLIDSFEVREGKLDENESLLIPEYKANDFVSNNVSGVAPVARGQFFYAKDKFTTSFEYVYTGYSLCRAMTDIIPSNLDLPNLAEDIIMMSKNGTPTNTNLWQKVLYLPNKTRVVPVGTIFYIVANVAPEGYFIADGGAVSRTIFSELYNLIGTTYGAGDGSTTFNKPNLMGTFIRCANPSKTAMPDYGRQVGTRQEYATAAPRTQEPDAISVDNGKLTTIDKRTAHPSYIGFVRRAKADEDATSNSFNSGWNGTDSPAGEVDLKNVCAGDAETRPVNIALLPIIKW